MTVLATATAATRRPSHPGVTVDPWGRCLLAVLPMLALWTVVRLGRLLCLVAQRVPPAVRLVRAVQEQRARRAA